MTVKIIARISKKNYKALKRLAKYKGTDAVINQALKQFFDKNHNHDSYLQVYRLLFLLNQDVIFDSYCSALYILYDNN